MPAIASAKPPATQDLPTEADYSSANEDKPVPLIRGRRKVPLLWMSDLLSVESIQTPTKGAGKESKKGGGGNQKTYYCSIAGLIGHGPISRIFEITADSTLVWAGNYALGSSSVDLTPADPTDLLASGYVRLYPGSETQAVDGLFSGGPAFLGSGVLALKGFKMGNERGNPRDMNVTVAALPVADPSIIPSTANTFSADGQYAINPIALIAEILLSPAGLGWSVSRLDAASWSAEAQACWDDRQAYAQCHVLFDSFEVARSKLADLFAMADVAPRFLANGKLGLARIVPGYVPATAATFDARHFRDGAPLKPKGSGLAQLKTKFQVRFYDSDNANLPVRWKDSAAIVPDAWALRVMSYVPHVAKISRPLVGTMKQAHAHGVEAARRQAQPALTATASLRSAEIAVDTAGNPVRPGDKHWFDIEPIPGGAAVAALAIVTQRTDRADGGVDVEIETDSAAAVQPYLPAWSGITAGTPTAASIVHALGVPTPPSGADKLGVHVLVTRPATSIHGARVFFGLSTSGEFVELGAQDGFACRATLVSDISDTATTIRLSFPDGESGPDGYLAGETPENAITAESDTLLLLLARIDGSGTIRDNSGSTEREWISLVGRTAVGAGVYDYTVLRGRKGTSARAWAFSTWGAGERAAWIVAGESLERFRAPAMDGLVGTGTRAYVRLASITVGAEDQTVPLPTFPALFVADMATATVGAGDYVDFRFIRSASAPSTPTGDTPAGWSDAPPSGTDPLYMIRGKKTSAGVLIGVWSAPVRIDGPAGSNGTNGSNGSNGTNGAAGDSVQVQYSVDGSTSWHDTFTTGDLYMRQRVGTGTWSAGIKIVGEDGADGTNGSNGADGQSVQIEYSVDGSTSWHGTFAGGDLYMRQRLGSGSWSGAIRVVGLDGSNGTPGIPGSDGATSYFHVKYSNDGGTTFTASSGEVPGDWIGTRVDFTLADSSTPGDYTWAKIKGEPGGSQSWAPSLTAQSAYTIRIEWIGTAPADVVIFWQKGTGTITQIRNLPVDISMANGTESLNVWTTAAGLAQSDVFTSNWNDSGGL